jgi:hypothetical protein
MVMKGEPQSGIRVRRKGTPLPASAFDTATVIERLQMRAASLEDHGWSRHAADVRLGIGELVKLQAEVVTLRSGFATTLLHVDARRVGSPAVAAARKVDKRRGGAQSRVVTGNAR